jgi:DNA-binding transcriptional LysR family regulator
MKNVTFRQLRVFESVARLLSFSRAAEELHLTQPAVSMQVRQLEDSVGLALTEQIGKKIHLTAAGAEMALHARLISQQLAVAEEALAALKGLRSGRLVIGVVSTAKYFAPRLLATFRARHPGVELRLDVQNREEIVRRLHDNRIDIAIMGTPPLDFPTVSEAFAEHPLIIVGGIGHPLANRSRVELRELGDETFLIRELGSGTRTAMERFFAEHGFTCRSVMEMSSNETIKQAVMAGMGVAFLSAHTMGPELATGRLLRIDVVGTPVLRKWHVVRHRDKRLLPLAHEFDLFLRSEGPQVIADLGEQREPARTAGPARRRGERGGRRTEASGRC